MTIKSAIASVFLGGLVFIVGGGLGILYQSQKMVVQPLAQTQEQATPSIVKTLSSKVIPSIVAYGTVTAISGRNITITYQGDSATIGMKTDAKIYTFVPAKAGSKAAPTTALVDFKDIKKGDSVNIAMKVLPSGQFEGFSLVTLPAASVPTTPPK